MRYVRCLDKLDMTDTIHLKIKIRANPSYLCYLWFALINYHLIFKLKNLKLWELLNYKPACNG